MQLLDENRKPPKATCTNCCARSCAITSSALARFQTVIYRPLAEGHAYHRK
jgi:hypothetical protein